MTAIRPGRVDRVAQSLLRALWLAIIPALLAGLVMRYGVPPFAGNEMGLLGATGKLIMESPAIPAMGLWIFFSALLRYWRFYLPGGVHLSRLPAPIAIKCANARLADYDALVATYEWATSNRGTRLAKKLTPEDQESLLTQTAALEEAVSADHLEQARGAAAEIESASLH